ncbi:hypothetical protein SprV_0301320500 [Sparganum proliferum]
MDVDNSGPFPSYRVRNHCPASQLQHFAEAAEIEVYDIPGMARVDGQGLRPVQKCLQDDKLVNLQLGAQLKTVVIPYGFLEPTEGLAGFRDPVNHSSSILMQRESVSSRASEVVYDLQFSAFDVDAKNTVCNVEGQLVYDHCFDCIDGQSEVGASGVNEIRVPVDVLFGRGVERAVFGEEQVVDCCRRLPLWGLHVSVVEKMSVTSLGDAYPRALIIVVVHHHSRVHKTEKDDSEYTTLSPPVGLSECLRDSPVVRDARHHP